jgi:hypothetical protein
MQSGLPFLDQVAAHKGDAAMRGRHDDQPGNQFQKGLKDFPDPTKRSIHLLPPSQWELS